MQTNHGEINVGSNRYELHENGDKIWRNSAGQLHRTDGPAIEYADGTKWWYIHGQLHRTDGPAIERANGTKYWWFNDQQYTEEEYYSKEFQVKIVMES